MNLFDAAIYVVTIVAVVTGFNSGLLRSIATILGYVCAMPMAVAMTSYVAPMVAGKSDAPWTQHSLFFFGIFLVMGIVMGGLLRIAVSETVGPSVSLPDRLAGSVLGAVRVFLVAVTLVLIFDRLIPADRQPAYLVGSQLRPLLSVAGQAGLKSLPPETTAFIDQWKRERRM
jgi:membrane protein required for colicin V production